MLRGWKAICQHTGFCKDTLRRWRKKHGFPVVYIEGKTVASKAAIEIWLAEKLKSPQFIHGLSNNFTKTRSKPPNKT